MSSLWSRLGGRTLLIMTLAAHSCASAAVITNDDVVELVKAGLDDAVIIAAIEAGEPKFDTSTAGLVKLRAAGTSNPLILRIISVASSRNPSQARTVPSPGDGAPAKEITPVRTAPILDFLKCQMPERNKAALLAGTFGKTVIVFTMGVDGLIKEAAVERSSGTTREHKQLDRLAIEAVLACKGVPGTLDGVPQKLTSRVSYDWHPIVNSPNPSRNPNPPDVSRIN